MNESKSAASRVTVSVVAPVYREEASIDEFLARSRAALDQLELPDGWELILVDDGSPDSSIEHIRKAASCDNRIRAVRLSRNFGHQVAVSAGIDYATGDAVVIIDSDLQDPPEIIIKMVEEWRRGAEVVYGVRSSRKGESAFKLLTARTFYRVMSRLSDTPLSNNVGDFRLVDRKVVEVLRSMREENRYLRGMVPWIGFRQIGVEYVREPRFAGRSTYSLPRMLRLALNGVTGFSERPLQLAFQLGGCITLVGFGYLLWIVISVIIGPSHSVAGFASLMCAILFLGGIQLLSIGLLGLYVGRIFREVKQRPLYVVAEVVNV
jgi:polyisoprenyl-phosphate glycosyltransferase